MDQVNTVKRELVYPKESYKINGILFKVHNELGRFCTEKQYCDLLENFLRKEKISYEREKSIKLPEEELNKIKDRTDFIIDDKIILEIKAKKFIGRNEYYQTQRYLSLLNKKLAILVNFHSKYIYPKRILNAKFVN